ncbi:hypothetical protein ACHAWT_009640 [Skeletonema menzelii]
MDDDNNTPPQPPPFAEAAAAAPSSRTISEHLALTLQTIDQLTTIFSFPPHIATLAVETIGPEDVTQCYNWILDNYNDLDDCGGPVVPKLDCPHLQLLLDGGDGNDVLEEKLFQLIQQSKRNDDETRNGNSGDDCCNKVGMKNLFQMTCQHYSSLMKRPTSRKRLRSEDDNTSGHETQLREAVVPTGQLKREEDYDDNNDINETATASTTSTNCCNGKENWLCVQCGLLLCSSIGDKKEATGHCIAISLADLSVWCYECNAYLHHDSLVGLMKRLEALKFGSSDSGDGESNDVDEVMEGEQMEGVDASEATKPAAVDFDSNQKQSSVGLGINKRKSQPKKLSVGQGETAVLSSPSRVEGGNDVSSQLAGQNKRTTQDEQDDSSSENSLGSGDGSENNESDGENSSSGASSGSSHQAAILATLLQGEQGEAIRAYLNRHESFNTSDMGQCVPMHMPAPPTFPNEMADFLRSPLCQSICVLAGAGMSVSSGIPDFRSAGVGLYDTIRPELLTATEIEQAIIEDDPTVALDKGMFLRNPLPMLELKRDFILGTHTKKWKATLAHRFIELLHTKLGKLTRLYTQNIDGLELQTSIPKEKIVNVHGSMGAAACELCEAEVDFDVFCEKISSNIKDITGRDENAPASSTPITCEACGNPTVKPTIVLFRGAMPQLFHRRVAEDLPDCDLLIIMGTSLQVAPANSLVYRVPPTALRMVMNNEKVGRRLGIIYGEESIRDVFAYGHSDETCLDLAEQMGWLSDLAEIIDELPESSARLLRQRLEQREEE